MLLAFLCLLLMTLLFKIAPECGADGRPVTGKTRVCGVGFLRARVCAALSSTLMNQQQTSSKVSVNRSSQSRVVPQSMDDNSAVTCAGLDADPASLGSKGPGSLTQNSQRLRRTQPCE